MVGKEAMFVGSQNWTKYLMVMAISFFRVAWWGGVIKTANIFKTRAILTTNTKHKTQMAVVVAQLVERSFPTPEIHGSIPDIGKFLSSNCTIEKTKIKKKRPGMAHLKKELKNIRLKTFSILIISNLRKTDILVFVHTFQNVNFEDIGQTQLLYSQLSEILTLMQCHEPTMSL